MTTRSTPSLRNPIHLTLVQARFQLVEAVRIPISIVMGLLAPSVGLLFFVLPQRAVAEDPHRATAAVIGLAVFGVMVNSLFQFAVEVSQARERPWGSFTRTLPGGTGPRFTSYLLSSGVLAVASIIPLLLLAAFTTEARLEWPELVVGIVSLVVTALPFMLLGIAIGYLLGSKAAVAVSQVLMLVLAFGGGLFMPASTFPGWADTLSMFLPTRHALEIVTWATGLGGEYLASSIMGWIGWTFALALSCAILAGRDPDKVFAS